MAPLGLGVGFYELGPTLEQGGKVWDPAFLGEARILHWYKFNKDITTNETGITKWGDALPLQNHLQPSVSNDANEQPELTAAGTVFFEQATDSLIFESPLTLTTFSIYLKHKFSAGETVAEHRLIEGSHDYIEFYSPTEIRINIGAVHKITIPEIIEGEEYVFGIERDSNGDIKAYKDNVVGSAAGGTSNNISPSTANDLTQIGDPLNESEVFEIIICSSALTASQRDALYQYLSQVG